MHKERDENQDDLVCTRSAFASLIMFYYRSLIRHVLSDMELIADHGTSSAEDSDACTFASNKGPVLILPVMQSLTSTHERIEFARKLSHISSDPDHIVTH
jgi:hypothetical protein